jgi:hypothetical protein
MPRVISRELSPAKKMAAYFYGAVKQEEHIRSRLGLQPLEDAQPPENEQTDPANNKTAQIFQLKAIYGIRKLSLDVPGQRGPDEADVYWILIKSLAEETYTKWLLKIGLTPEYWLYILRKFYLIQVFTHGVIPLEAYGDTIAQARRLILIFTRVAMLPGIDVLYQSLPYLAVFFVLTLYTPDSGKTEFQQGRVLIKKSNGLFWGQIVGHTTKKMLDFYLISPAYFWPYQWELNYTDHPYRTDYIHLDSIQQSYYRSFLGYPVFTWEKVETVFRGMAFQAAPLIYRMEADPNELSYWNLPLGWVNTDMDLLNFPNYIEPFFSYNGFSYPPL